MDWGSYIYSLVNKPIDEQTKDDREMILFADFKSKFKNINNPKDITHWYQGHVDWKTTEATNLLKVGEIFSYVMVDKDQKSTFTLKGTYTTIVKYKKIGYLMEDKRMVETTFSKVNNRVLIIQRVEIESGNSAESQATWWRSILINFKKHLESKVI